MKIQSTAAANNTTTHYLTDLGVLEFGTSTFFKVLPKDRGTAWILTSIPVTHTLSLSLTHIQKHIQFQSTLVL